MNICQYRFITVFIVRCLNHSLRKAVALSDVSEPTIEITECLALVT